MSTARNNITGALLKTKPATNNYRDGYDAIFGKKEIFPIAEFPNEPVTKEDIEKLSEAMSHLSEGQLE